ncbi:DUF928 domain-containing protein [Candidatus Nitrospira nitrificans]|uniref:DUF928 domain-containing protein n=1 Tax=Candidatus Nitrospira nitrificans TaxID=1742973 RepID=A0A0S4L7S4_9BACT|nr:DUF928 domain-containing protein [Candidatus Nitrospira nitrificans]CUS32653.1 conserved exported hypothetical protein [Candidatus Nitrospira nitrificans]
MRYVLTLGLSLLLTVSGMPILDAADGAITVTTAERDDEQLPVYAPPKKLTPRARVGGTLRGTDSSEPELVALVPDHVGLTVKQTPTLNWYLSKPTTYPLRFTLNDTQKIIPIYEGSLPIPTQAGVQSIDLKRLGLTLEPNVQYRWFVSASPNAESPSRDIVAGGMIERCEFSECLTVTSVNVSCDRDSVRTNALIGFWYDAMGCVCSLIEKEPNDPSLRRLRAALLRQVGLNGVADWDLRSIQSHTK